MYYANTMLCATYVNTPVASICDDQNRGHGRCTVFGNIFKFSWPPFFIEGLYVGSMN